MMPLIVKDFTWSQNSEWIFIVLEVKGVKAGSTTVVSSPTYLKAHWPPHIFEVFLLHEVVDSLSECTIDEQCGKVSFRLKKATAGLSWEQLENKALTKEEKRGSRSEAIRITHETHERDKSDKQKRAFDRKQTTVHDQMRLDSEDKERIAQIKTAEGEKALTELNDWVLSSTSCDSARTPNSKASSHELWEGVCHNSRSIISGGAQPQRVAGNDRKLRSSDCTHVDNIEVSTTPCTKDAVRRKHSDDDDATCLRNGNYDIPDIERHRIWSRDESQLWNDVGGGDGPQVNIQSSSWTTVITERRLSPPLETVESDSLSGPSSSPSMKRETGREAKENNICSTGPPKLDPCPQVVAVASEECSISKVVGKSTISDDLDKSSNCSHSMGRTLSQQIRKDSENPTVAIRPTVCITVNFTPREFPTPSRESTLVEEQEWLTKQAEARRLSGFVDEDLRPEERNPQWLLDKGLSLMRTESYLGAISAFSLGIRLAPKLAELYVERSAAHLAVKNYHRTVEDTSQGLELLTPKVRGNEGDRLKCHIRRGTAFRALSMWEEALADYQEAIRLQPKNNEELTQARDQIQMALETARHDRQQTEEEKVVTQHKEEDSS